MDIYGNQSHRYLERLEALYQEIEAWLSNSRLRFNRRSIPMDEGVGEPYDAPALVVTDAGGEEVATVTPFGWNIIGAEGQVRVVGRFATRIVTYFTDNGPRLNAGKSVGGRVAEAVHVYLLSGVGKPGWYMITNPKTGETRPLDSDLLKEILAEVSDYGV